jgi:hypothetical protein
MRRLIVLAMLLMLGACSYGGYGGYSSGGYGYYDRPGYGFGSSPSDVPYGNSPPNPGTGQ